MRKNYERDSSPEVQSLSLLKIQRLREKFLADFLIGFLRDHKHIIDLHFFLIGY